MALERQAHLVGRNAATVVADQQTPYPALLDFHLDPRRLGIEAVFHQFLNDGHRAFNHLAGGDLVDEGIGELADAGAGHSVGV